MEHIQIKPAGQRIISRGSFWQITKGGRPYGWANSYKEALIKAREAQNGGAGHATA